MLGPLLAAFVSGETGLAIQRAKRAAIAYAVAGVFALVAVIFLMLAGYHYAARALGPIAAALWIAGGFLVIAVLVVVIHQFRAAAIAKQAARKRQTDAVTLGTTAALAALPSLLRSRKGATAAFIGPIGLAVAYALYKRRKDADDDL